MDRHVAWIELPSEEEMKAGAQRRNYDFGFVTGMSRLLRAHGPIGEAFGALYAQIMFAPGHLDRDEREMVAAIAAAAQDCHY
jgi:alkylhydroperoxidase/carboxymuconolactone decarboxylase family protein YurZ